MLSLRILFISLLLAPYCTVLADGWEVVQTVSSSTDIRLSQGAAQSSYQAINHIATANINTAHQSVTANNVALIQEGTANIQSLNMLSGVTVNSSFNQSVAIKSVTFSSDGSGNIQAGNYIKADTLNGGSQQFNAETVSFNGSGSNNIQAGNYIKANKATASQSFSAKTVYYGQSGSNNIQAGNIAITNNAITGGVVAQNFYADNVEADFLATDTQGSIKAANYYLK